MTWRITVTRGDIREGACDVSCDKRVFCLCLTNYLSLSVALSKHHVVQHKKQYQDVLSYYKIIINFYPFLYEKTNINSLWPIR